MIHPTNQNGTSILTSQQPVQKLTNKFLPGKDWSTRPPNLYSHMMKQSPVKFASPGCILMHTKAYCDKHLQSRCHCICSTHKSPPFHLVRDFDTDFLFLLPCKSGPWYFSSAISCTMNPVVSATMLQKGFQSSMFPKSNKINLFSKAKWIEKKSKCKKIPTL